MLGLIIFFVLVIVFFVTVVAVWAIRTTDPKSEGVIHLTRPKTTVTNGSLEALEADKKRWEELEKQARENGGHYSRTVITTTVSSTGEKVVSVQNTEINQKIKCKFCGYSINIDKDATCPQCGAPYDIAEAKAETEARIQKIMDEQAQKSAYKQVY